MKRWGAVASLILLASLGVAGTMAQSAAPSPVELASTVSATGLRFVDGVRYTVTALQPPGSAAHHLVAEIALPAGAELLDAFGSAPLQFRGTRVTSEATSLIWTADLVPADAALGPFAFTLREPLTGPLTVFLQWAGDDPNQIQVISTYVTPELREAGNDLERVTVPRGGTGDLVPVGATGVWLYVAPDVVSEETSVLVGEMSTDLNPPPEYGMIWWCSGLALAGLPDGAQVQVLVPLRRPLPPLTTTALFALQPDNTWRALDDKGVVTLDGQYVAYTHPGGVIATGVEGELRPEEQPPVEALPQDAPPPPPPPAEPPPPVEPPPPPPPAEAVIAANPPPPPAEAPPEPPPVEQPTLLPPTDVPPTEVPVPTSAPLADGAANTTNTAAPVVRPVSPTVAVTRSLIVIGALTATAIQPTSAPDHAAPTATATQGLATLAPFVSATPVATQPAITDGSSNTVIIGEATRTATPPSADGSVRFVTLAPFNSPTPAPTQAAITDGSSNTIIVGEATRTATLASAPTRDGSVRFVTLAPFIEATPTAAPRATQPAITDGSSNTIIIGEATPTGAPTRVGNVRIVTLAPFIEATPTQQATFAGVTDGSSNTIFIGEATRTATQRATQPAITDGSSNTVIIGESTSTPTPVGTLLQGDAVVGTPSGRRNTPTPTQATVGDGGVRFVTLAPFVSATPTATQQATQVSISDGSSNTIILGEAPSTATPASAQTGDGGVRFVTLAPFVSATPTAAPRATQSGITDGSSNTIIIGEATHTSTPPNADGSVRFVTLAPLVESTPTLPPQATQAGITDGSSNTIVIGEVTQTPSPAPDQVAASATLVLDARGTPIAVGDTPLEGEDQLTVVRRTRDQVAGRGGTSSGVALEAIAQVFPQVGTAVPTATPSVVRSPVPPTTAPPTAPPAPPLPTALLLATLTPTPSQAPTAAATLRPEPMIVFSANLPACASGGAHSTALCLTASQALQVCAPGADVCLSRVPRQNQLCIQFPGQRAPICTRVGR